MSHCVNDRDTTGNKTVKHLLPGSLHLNVKERAWGSFLTRPRDCMMGPSCGPFSEGLGAEGTDLDSRLVCL